MSSQEQLITNLREYTKLYKDMWDDAKDDFLDWSNLDNDYLAKQQERVDEYKDAFSKN